MIHPHGIQGIPTGFMAFDAASSKVPGTGTDTDSFTRRPVFSFHGPATFECTLGSRCGTSEVGS